MAEMYDMDNFEDFERDDIARELEGLVEEQAQRRDPIAKRWLSYLRQYGGKYDEAVETVFKSDENSSRSKLSANKTRSKTRVMASRLTDILFPVDELNWEIKPSPDAEMEAMIAQAACDAMRKVMEDQLERSRFEDIAVKAIMSMCKYGTGVVKGPMTELRPRPRWVIDGETGESRLEFVENDQPYFEEVDLFDFYPDMDAARLEDCNFIFQLRRVGRREIRRWMRDGMFIRENLDKLLRTEPGEIAMQDYFNYRRSSENEAVDAANESRYHVFEYHGEMEVEKFRELVEQYGNEAMLDAVGEGDRYVDVQLFFCEGLILRFGLNPFESGEHMYSIFRLDPDETGLFGPGIPEMMEDAQRALNSAFRVMMDNGALAGVPMFLVSSSLRAESGEKVIEPGKVWIQQGPSDANAILPIHINPSGAEQERVMEIASQLIDDETLIPLIAHGEQSNAPQQTAHGMALLANSVNIIFRAAVRSFDTDLTIPCIRRLYDWNMQFSDKMEIKGDMEVKARGSSTLLVRDIQNERLMMVLNLAANNEEIRMMVKIPEVARQLFKGMQLPIDDMVLTDEELDALREQMAQQEQPPTPEEAKLQVAQINSQTQLSMKEMEIRFKEMEMNMNRVLEMARMQSEKQVAMQEMLIEQRKMMAEFAIKQQHGTGI